MSTPPKEKKLDTVSTATLIWGTALLVSVASTAVGLGCYIAWLVLPGMLIGLICFIGTAVSFIVHEDKKSRARIEHNERIMAEKKAEADRIAAENARIAAEKRAAEEERRRKEREEWFAHHDFISFPVKGVTFKNDDGTSRQSHLKAIMDALAIGDKLDIEFVQYEYNGDPAIRLDVDGRGIGHVPADLVPHITDILPKIEKVNLTVETFIPDDDPHKIYRADVYITCSKD